MFAYLQEGQVQRLRHWHRHGMAGALPAAPRIAAGVALLWLAGLGLLRGGPQRQLPTVIQAAP